LQRILDIVFAVTALILLSPVFLVTIIILSLKGDGEIFFSQPRIGRYGKQINILKFATMLKNSPNIGTGTITLKDDPRILPFGNFLRKTKINELPQLLNIIIGQMSFIGPRPQTKRCFDAFPETSQKMITLVRPGLSGVGSIYFRNEENILNDARNAQIIYNKVIMPFKGELEEWYVNNQSIRLYFKLILFTVVTVLGGLSSTEKLKLKNVPKIPSELEQYF
jgi:lipopolysaccharide/colanic/teichoic acid biosynthesis glycosyltransferase